MNLAVILALVGLSVRAAPMVIAFVGSLVKMFTPAETDVRVTVVQERALAFLNELLDVARRTSLEVENLDFGQPTKDEQNLARFSETLESVRGAASAIRSTLTPEEAAAFPALTDGKLETIAQAGFAIGRYRAALPTP